MQSKKTRYLFYHNNFRREFLILDNCEEEDFAIVCQLIFDLIFLTGFEPDLEGFILRLTFSSPKYFALFKQELIIYLYQKRNLVHSNIEIKLWILCGLEWNLMKINLTRLFGPPTFFCVCLKAELSDCSHLLRELSRFLY